MKKARRLFTQKKQNEEKHLTEIRKQALLTSGAQIEGLQQSSGSGPPVVKNVVYGNLKKKGSVAQDVSPTPESRPRSLEPVTSLSSPLPSIIGKRRRCEVRMRG